jgi:hypothetical protein
MGEELSRLLAISLVKEVQHLDWIVSPVLVLKKMEHGGCVLITQA